MVVLPGWSPVTERTFKEILFRFLEELQSTKAALYLRAPETVFVLTTQYGFGRRDQLAAEHGPDDPMARRALELRSEPAIVNDARDDPELGPYLAAGGTSRLLLVPLYSGIRTFGFVDVRDKGRRRPFEDEDVAGARSIADVLLAELAATGLFSDLVSPSAPSVPEHPSEEHPVAVIDVAGAGPPPMLCSQGAVAVVEAAKAATAEPGVAAVAVTIVTPSEGGGVVWVRDGADDVDATALHRHQDEALRDAGLDAIHPSEWNLRRIVVPATREATRSLVIATERVAGDAEWSLLLSVVGSGERPVAKRVSARLSTFARSLVESEQLRYARRRLARTLLEPGEASYEALVIHSLAVSKVTHRIASLLGWDDDELELAALAGLLHDVGMRELEYDRLYQEPSPRAEDQKTYRRHVTVGEDIIHSAGLDAIVPAVRHHHERWDGRGYPDRLAGSAIPPLARILHLAEVYDTLTAATSYRPSVPRERALEIIRAASGQQFDPELVPLLEEAVS